MSLLLWTGVAAATVCTGCATPDTPQTIATYEQSSDEEGGDSALLEGTIKTRDGCTLVIGENVDGLFVPILGSDDEKILSLSDGDPVRLKGGVVTKPPESSSIPEGCNKTDLQYWLVSY
jgi:hypothetical protein